jgi:nucleoside transporter
MTWNAASMSNDLAAAPPEMANSSGFGIRGKLTLMMLIELFIWGAWLPPLFYLMGDQGLNFTSMQKFLVGSTFAIASVLGIFFSNQFADRTFAAEKFLAFSHFVSGLALVGLFFAKSFAPFFGLMLLHSLFYVPTLSVANSLAFANLKDPSKDFGPVRLGGTIGWILAQWPIAFFLYGKSADVAAREVPYTFLAAALASFILAAFCLTLPHTPPKPAVEGEDSLAWRKAMSLLANPFLLVLFIVTFFDATIHNGYFVLVFDFLAKIGVEPAWVTPVMSLGQIAEIGTMAVLGAVLAKLGWRTTMVIGILGHAARYAVFAFFPTNIPLIIVVQLLHGICYAFFFATVYIFIDAAFPKDVRASAQGLFNLLILGLGDIAAKLLFVPLMDNWRVTETVKGVETSSPDFAKIFLVPTVMAIAAAIFLAVAFKPPATVSVTGEGGAAPH